MQLMCKSMYRIRTSPKQHTSIQIELYLRTCTLCFPEVSMNTVPFQMMKRNSMQCFTRVGGVRDYFRHFLSLYCFDIPEMCFAFVMHSCITTCVNKVLLLLTFLKMFVEIPGMWIIALKPCTCHICVQYCYCGSTMGVTMN